MLRKALGLLLVLVLMGVVAPNAAAQETCTGEKVSLRLDDWSSGDRVQYMEQVLEAFSKEYPCIEVVREPSPGGGEEQHVRRLTMIAAGTAPDLLAADSKMIPLYVEGGGFMDLTSVMEAEGFKPEEVYDPNVWKMGFYQGKPYLIPKDYSTSAFYVNAALFEKAGIELPVEGWTYDDYLDMAMQLTLDANGNNAASPDFDPAQIVQYGTDLINDGWFRGYQSFLYSWGAHTISEDGKTVEGYINSEAAVTAWSWYRDLVHTHHVAPLATEIGAYEGGRLAMFQNGLTAFGGTYWGPWFQDVLNENPDFKWGVVPLPTGPGGHRSAVMMMGWGINPNTKYPNEAWQLLKWLTTDPGQRVFALKALTAVPAVADELQRTDDPYWGVFLAEAGYLDTLDEHLNKHYEVCVYLPAGDLLTRTLSPGGEALDIKAELDTLAATSQKCLDDAAAEDASK